jgi:hypothetical protein
MLEALWSVTFVSNANIPLPGGGGIVVLETGRVLGGDTGFTYIGTFGAMPGTGKFHADVAVTKYRDVPGMQSVFGPLTHFNLKLEGTPAREQFRAAGHVVENPNMKIVIEFVRRAELP